MCIPLSYNHHHHRVPDLFKTGLPRFTMENHGIDGGTAFYLYHSLMCFAFDFLSNPNIPNLSCIDSIFPTGVEIPCQKCEQHAEARCQHGTSSWVSCHNATTPAAPQKITQNTQTHTNTDTQTHTHTPTRTRTRTRNIIAECVKRQAPPGFWWCPQVLWFAIFAKELQAAHLALPVRFRRDRLRNNVGKATL